MLAWRITTVEQGDRFVITRAQAASTGSFFTPVPPLLLDPDTQENTSEGLRFHTVDRSAAAGALYLYRLEVYDAANNVIGAMQVTWRYNDQPGAAQDEEICLPDAERTSPTWTPTATPTATDTATPIPTETWTPTRTPTPT
ncbi:MAG: hypothetical protein D6790_08170, partial [Caldilineae bacterium]